MRKICIFISLMLLISACNFPTLKRQSNINIGKTIIDNNQKYKLSKSGHSSSVSYSLEKDADGQISGMSIQIPIVYTEKKDSLPKELPTILKKRLNDMQKISVIKGNILKNNSSSATAITENNIWLRLSWNNSWHSMYRVAVSSVSGFIGTIIFSPIMIPVSALSGGTHFENDAIWEIQQHGEFTTFNQENLGVAIEFLYYPQKLHLSCEKQNCVVLDEKSNPVNKIYIHKKLKVEPKRINQLLLEEKKEKERQAKEKERQAKKEAERKRQQRILEAKQKKECPGLYQTLLYIQQYGTNVPSVAVKVGHRFQELNCDDYIQQQMSSYYY